MDKKAEVFEKTYEDYLKQLSEIEFSTKAEILGAGISGENLIIPLYGESYNVSGSGITDSRGRKANFSICVALSKYILMCPEEMSENISTDEKWVTFREFKDAGPLTVSFVNNTNKTIQNSFQDRHKLNFQ